MSDPVASLDEAKATALDAIDASVMAFARWLRTHWQMRTRAQWESENSEPWPGDEYARGYDAAVDQAVDAAEIFLEEQRS